MPADLQEAFPEDTEHRIMTVDRRGHSGNDRDPPPPHLGLACSESPAKFTIMNFPQLAENFCAAFPSHGEYGSEILAQQNCVPGRGEDAILFDGFTKLFEQTRFALPIHAAKEGVRGEPPKGNNLR